VITPASFNGIELRSGRVVNKPNPTVVIQEEEQVDNQAVQEEEQIDNQAVQEEEQMDNQLNEERNTLYNRKLLLTLLTQQKCLRKLILLLIQKGYL
jgi:hypothetical protein